MPLFFFSYFFSPSLTRWVMSSLDVSWLMLVAESRLFCFFALRASLFMTRTTKWWDKEDTSHHCACVIYALCMAHLDDPIAGYMPGVGCMTPQFLTWGYMKQSSMTSITSSTESLSLFLTPFCKDGFIHYFKAMHWPSASQKNVEAAKAASSNYRNSQL